MLTTKLNPMAALLTLTLFSSVAFSLPKTGEPLPDFTVADKGKMELNGEEISYQPFGAGAVKGKTTVLLLIAARESASNINKPFQETLSATQFPAGNRQVITVLGLDQAVFGTKGIALGRLKDKQKAFPSSNFVVDAAGSAREALGLEKKSYAVIVVSSNGRVIRAKDGALSQTEIDDFINAFRNDK